MDIVTDLNNVKNNKNKIYLAKRSNMQNITYTVYQEKEISNFYPKSPNVQIFS